MVACMPGTSGEGLLWQISYLERAPRNPRREISQTCAGEQEARQAWWQLRSSCVHQLEPVLRAFPGAQPIQREPCQTLPPRALSRTALPLGRDAAALHRRQQSAAAGWRSLCLRGARMFEATCAQTQSQVFLLQHAAFLRVGSTIGLTSGCYKPLAASAHLLSPAVVQPTQAAVH